MNDCVMLIEIFLDELICYGIIFFVFLILIFLGNSLVCFVVWRLKNLRRLMNYLVCSLVGVDLLVFIFCVIYINILVYVGKWVFGIIWCYIFLMCGVFFCSVFIFYFCVISIERFIVIKWLLLYDVKVILKRIVIVLIYIWVQFFVLFIFFILGFVEQCFNLVLVECEINWFKKLILIILLIVFYFFLLVFVMFIVYVIIFKEVCRNSCRIFVLESVGN